MAVRCPLFACVGFHDGIYDARKQDNEERSAAWAEEVSLRAGLSQSVATRIRDLIVATKHNAIPDSGDSRLLVDIDLAILGAPAWTPHTR